GDVYQPPPSTGHIREHIPMEASLPPIPIISSHYIGSTVTERQCESIRIAFGGEKECRINKSTYMTCIPSQDNCIDGYNCTISNEKSTVREITNGGFIASKVETQPIHDPKLGRKYSTCAVVKHGTMVRDCIPEVQSVKIVRKRGHKD